MAYRGVVVHGVTDGLVYVGPRLLGVGAIHVDCRETLVSKQRSSQHVSIGRRPLVVATLHCSVVTVTHRSSGTARQPGYGPGHQ